MSSKNVPPGFVAVHAGAGWHAPAKERAYASLLSAAAQAAGTKLAAGASALDAVAAALRALEESPLTNAGYGSNLTRDGAVEADASVMAGDGAFGALAAVPGVRHPGAAAARLAAESRQPLPLGLVRPMVLAGDGARRWALARGLEAAPTAEAASEWLISPEARASWRRYTRMLQDAQRAGDGGTDDGGSGGSGGNGSGGAEAGAASTEQPPSKRARQEAPTGNGGQGPPMAAAAAAAAGGGNKGGEAQLQPPPRPQLADACDTVGAVVVAADGAVAAGVSSGGLALKQPGRVGEAAVYGAGAWAADPSPGWPPASCCGDGSAGGDDGSACPGAAVSVSGLGEAVVRASVARAAADALRRGAGADPAASACGALLEASMVHRGCGGGGGGAGSSGGDAPAALADGAASAEGGGGSTECGVLAARVTRFLAPPSTNANNSTTAATASAARRRVRVELAAATTAPSFAVAWLAPGMAEAHVLRLPGLGSASPVALLETSCAWDVPEEQAGGGGEV